MVDFIPFYVNISSIGGSLRFFLKKVNETDKKLFLLKIEDRLFNYDYGFTGIY